MKKVKQTFISLSLVVFFLYAGMTLVQELHKSYETLRSYYGFSDDEKREALLGDVFTFADLCNKIIPQNERVLFLTNLPSNSLSEDLFTSYYMYPRKLFWLNNSEPYPEAPPGLDEIDYKGLAERCIQWIVLRFPEGFDSYSVIRINDKKAAALYTLDVKGKTYDRVF